MLILCGGMFRKEVKAVMPNKKNENKENHLFTGIILSNVTDCIDWF